MDVFFARTKKIQKVHANVFAGLADAQENQVFFEAFLGGTTSEDIPKPSKRFDRMFGIIVVPGDVVVIDEREELVSVFFKAFHTSQRGRTLVIPHDNFSIKAIYRSRVLSQKMLLQPTTVNVLDDGLQKLAEIPDDGLQLLVVWVSSQPSPL